MTVITSYSIHYTKLYEPLINCFVKEVGYLPIANPTNIYMNKIGIRVIADSSFAQINRGRKQVFELSPRQPDIYGFAGGMEAVSVV